MKNYSMISYQKQHLDQLNLYHTFYFLDRIDDDEINLRVHVNEENEKYSARYLVPVESYRKLVEFLENVDLEKEAVHGKGQTDKGNTDLNKEWLDFEMEDGKTYQVTEMNEYLRQIPDMMKEIERISGEPLYRNPRQAPSSKESQPQPAATAPESQDFWICPTCGKKLTRQFCFSCGTSRSNNKPSIVSTSMDDASWICPNCGNECHGNFCMACGNRKVVCQWSRMRKRTKMSGSVRLAGVNAMRTSVLSVVCLVLLFSQLKLRSQPLSKNLLLMTNQSRRKLWMSQMSWLKSSHGYALCVEPPVIIFSVSAVAP